MSPLNHYGFFFERVNCRTSFCDGCSSSLIYFIVPPGVKIITFCNFLVTSFAIQLSMCSSWLICWASMTIMLRVSTFGSLNRRCCLKGCHPCEFNCLWFISILNLYFICRFFDCWWYFLCSLGLMNLHAYFGEQLKHMRPFFLHLIQVALLTQRGIDGGFYCYLSRQAKLFAQFYDNICI